MQVSNVWMSDISKFGIDIELGLVDGGGTFSWIIVGALRD